VGGWADDVSRTRRARHGVAPRRAVSATSAAGTAPTSAVRWSRERRALPFEHARDVGRRKHLQSSAAQPSRSDRSQRSRAARDIPCRAGFNHDAVRDIPCHMGYGYAPPCGGRGIRGRGGYGSDAVRDILFLAAEAVELELLAVRQHVRVEELLEPMPQRHARLHAACGCAPTSHADITAALGLSAAQPMAVPQWRICCCGGRSHADSGASTLEYTRRWTTEQSAAVLRFAAVRTVDWSVESTARVLLGTAAAQQSGLPSPN
jgi:hypothetical protein